MNKREKAFHPVWEDQPGEALHSIVTDIASQEIHVQKPGSTSGPSTQGAQVDARARNYRAINQSLVTLTCACQEVKRPYQWRYVCAETFDPSMWTLPDPYLMPRIEELLDRIENAKFISVFDLRKGFYQVPMKEEDKPKTAFMSIMGKFQVYEDPFWVERGSRNLSEVNGQPT